MSLLEQASLVMIPSGYKEDVVYCPKPTDGSGDLTFTRASDGTRVNSAGLVENVPWNLLQQSNTFNTTWVLSNATVTSGQTGYDGTNNAWLLASTTDGGRIVQSLNAQGLQTYSVFAKAGTFNWVRFLITASTGNQDRWFDLSNGTQGGTTYNPLDSTITSVGNGWYRITLTYNESLTGCRIYPANANLQTIGVGNILIQDAQINTGTLKPYFPTTNRQNVPRLTYEGGCPSLLLEPQRTNLALYSEQFDTWSNLNATITANYGISPDGTQNADRYQRTAGTRGVVYRSIGVSSGTTYTISLYAKSLSGTQKIRIGADNGCPTPQGAETFSVGETWTRIETQIASTQTGWNVFFDNVESGTACTGTYLGADFLVWGFQVEAGSYATSYIPTTSAAVTRVADAAYKTGISSLIGQTEGVMFVDYNFTNTSNNLDSTPIRILGSGSASVYLEMNTNETLEVVVFNSVGTLVFNSTSATQSVGRIKVAVAYKDSDFAYYINGSQVGVQASGAFASASFDTLNLGMYSSGVQILADSINQAAIFKTRLTNAELAALTTL